MVLGGPLPRTCEIPEILEIPEIPEILKILEITEIPEIPEILEILEIREILEILEIPKILEIPLRRTPPSKGGGFLAYIVRADLKIKVTELMMQI